MADNQGTTTPAPIALELKLPDFSKELLAHAGMLLETGGKVTGNPAPNDPSFENHLDKHTVGKVIAEHLPPEMIQDLRTFFSRKGPPVLILRNFPITDESPKTKMVMEGIIYAMTMGSDKAPDANPRMIATDLLHHNRYGKETQRFHQDGPEDNPTDIGMLACIKESGNILTCFSRNSLEGFSTTTAAPDAVKALLKQGDIALYRNREILHGRLNPEGDNTGERVMRSVDIDTFIKQEQPGEWVKLVHQRAQDLLKTPPGK